MKTIAEIKFPGAGNISLLIRQHEGALGRYSDINNAFALSGSIDRLRTSLKTSGFYLRSVVIDLQITEVSSRSRRYRLMDICYSGSDEGYRFSILDVRNNEFSSDRLMLVDEVITKAQGYWQAIANIDRYYGEKYYGSLRFCDASISECIINALRILLELRPVYTESVRSFLGFSLGDIAGIRSSGAEGESRAYD